MLGQNGIASGIINKGISVDVTDSLTQASLFEVTTEYFISTLRENQLAITRHYEGPDIELRTFGSINEAAELTITSILIFSYMCLHPDEVLPIVVFNDDTQVDFISLSKNIGSIMASAKKNRLWILNLEGYLPDTQNIEIQTFLETGIV